MQFVPNSTGTAFLRCDAKIVSPQQYRAASPYYPPTGRKPSWRIYSDELTPRIVAGSPVGMTYHGDKSYIHDRIAYNLCSGSPLPNRYTDFASHAEAFDRASRLFLRSGRSIAGRGDASVAVAAAIDAGERRRTSQLLDDQDYERLLALQRQARPPREEKEEKKEDQPSLLASAGSIYPTRVESDRFGRRYANYPGSIVFFSCPVPADGIPREFNEQEMRNIRATIEQYNEQQTRAGNNPAGKTIYCGKQLQEILKAKMCGLFTPEQWNSLPTTLSTLGSPGVCFNKGASPLWNPDIQAD